MDMLARTAHELRIWDDSSRVVLTVRSMYVGGWSYVAVLSGARGRLKAICGQRAWPQSWTRWNIEGNAVEDLRAEAPLERVDVIHNETAVKSSESRSAAVARADGQRSGWSRT